MYGGCMKTKEESAAEAGDGLPVINFEPLKDYVVILPFDVTKSSGGIDLPEGTQIELPRGLVIAVGPGIYNDRGDIIPPMVKRGDTVALMFSERCNMIDLPLAGKSYLMVRSFELAGRIPRPEEEEAVSRIVTGGGE